MDFASQYPKKLRFENSIKKKYRSSELGDISFLYYLFVTSTGFKPVTFSAVMRCAIQLRHEAFFVGANIKIIV
jgi:hypothetical protein